MTKPIFRHRQLGEGHLTVALAYNQDKNNLDYAVSLCSPTDQFSRPKGRMIAEGRLQAYRSGRKTLSQRSLVGTINTGTSEPLPGDVVDTVVGLLLSSADENQLRWLVTVIP